MNVSNLGGAALRVSPATTNAELSGKMDHLPRVLLIEPDAKQQLAVEKTLRKEGFPWDLAISAEQAVSHLTRVGGETRDAARYGIVLLSDQVS